MSHERRPVSSDILSILPQRYANILKRPNERLKIAKTMTQVKKKRNFIGNQQKSITFAAQINPKHRR
jgi:hypothetical protein